MTDRLKPCPLCGGGSRWISVNDRLPEAGEPVLVFDGMDIHIGQRLSSGYWQVALTFGGSAIRYDIQSEAGIYYWMPLPEPPKKEGTE